ncbi:MAG: translation elongation factor Ts [Capsulimonadaceae bacterium]
MAEITAAMVKELRDKTGAGMMEAKKALTEAGGDMEAAIRSLREKHKNMTVKEGRTSAEGVIEAFVREHNHVGVLVEVNSETDFVARNEEFVALARFLARHVGDNPTAASIDELLDTDHSETGAPARNQLQTTFAKLRENIIFKRFIAFESAGTVDAYIHMGGQIGTLVQLTGEGPGIKELAREVAMHIAASRPKYLSRNEIPADVVENERAIVRTRTLADEKNANKPEAILEKIIEGGIGTFYKESVLLDQPYVREPKLTIAQLLQGKAEIVRFARYEVGEAGA